MPPVSKRVLCMHEDDDTCKTLTEPLTRLGHEVTSTASVSSALYAAATQHFDLFVIDRVGFDRVGMDVCKKLRQMNPQTPILVYAGPARGVDSGRADTDCATQFVSKPDINGLVSHVMKLT